MRNTEIESWVAAAMSRAVVRGVEREPYLAEVAREAAKRFGVDIEIVDDTFDAEHGVDVNAIYLFNPFVEALVLPEVGELACADVQRAAADIAATETFLAAARAGTRIVTFCGFGGEVPASYDRRVCEPWDGGVLELWEKRPLQVGRSAAVCEPLPTQTFAERRWFDLDHQAEADRSARR